MAEHKVHVAVGVLINANDEVLIARRTSNQVLAGYWEFPGGKLEANERPESALVREFQEEVGVTPLVFEPIKEIVHRYTHNLVHLHVFKITEFDGIAENREWQQLRWVKRPELGQYQFPEANQAILQAIGVLCA